MGKKVGTNRPSDGVYMCGGGCICTKLVVYAGGYIIVSVQVNRDTKSSYKEVTP